MLVLIVRVCRLPDKIGALIISRGTVERKNPGTVAELIVPFPVFPISSSGYECPALIYFQKIRKAVSIGIDSHRHVANDHLPVVHQGSSGVHDSQVAFVVGHVFRTAKVIRPDLPGEREKGRAIPVVIGREKGGHTAGRRGIVSGGLHGETSARNDDLGRDVLGNGGGTKAKEKEWNR